MDIPQPSSENPADVVWDEQALNRRRFLEVSFWASTGAATLTMAGIGGRFVVGDALEPTAEKWVEIGLVDELPSGRVHKAIYKVRTTDAWRKVEQTGTLYAFRDDGGTYTVLDAICTHLGCNVQWKEEGQQFYCPCHDASFSRMGEVVSGPPPRPLRRLQTKIEDGLLWALI